MKKSMISAAAVFLVLLLFVRVFRYGKALLSTKFRPYQHEEDAGADSGIGPDSMPVSDTWPPAST